MKSLLKYLRHYKKESVLAPLFKMLEASFELFVPLVVAAIIDVGIAGNRLDYVLHMGLVMILLGVIGLVCSITAQYFAAKAAVGFAAELKHALFAHIQSLSFTELDTIGTSTLITRMTSDVNQVQSGVNMFLRLFLRSPFVVAGAVVMAFTVNVRAALIFVGAVPLLSVVIFGVMLINIPLYRKVQGKLDSVLSLTRENLTGVRVIRAFHKEEEELADFEKRNQELTRVQIFAGKISALMNPLTYIIINGALVLLLWQGAGQVSRGVITQGELVALVNYMSQILVELIKLANLIITLTKAAACGKRIEAVFRIQSSMPAKRQSAAYPEKRQGAASEPVIQEEASEAMAQGAASQPAAQIVFDHVGLTYSGGGAEALTDLNFSIRKGQTVGIIGGTGSGKSSLVHLIPRFYDATRGRVLVDGMDVKDYSLEELRHKIGIVMQKAVLFKGTIRENLLWGNPDASEADLRRALEVSQAMEFVSEKEGGLDFVISQGGQNLSGGQRQRLSIARALVRNPEILILDDSSSALDFATDARLRMAIREMGSDQTVLIVSQRASSIRHADQIIVMEDGHAAGIGTHEELLESCQVYSEIYETQYQKDKGGKTDA